MLMKGNRGMYLWHNSINITFIFMPMAPTISFLYKPSFRSMSVKPGLWQSKTGLILSRLIKGP